jgi:hypothetical protein
MIGLATEELNENYYAPEAATSLLKAFRKLWEVNGDVLMIKRFQA